MKQVVAIENLHIQLLPGCVSDHDSGLPGFWPGDNALDQLTALSVTGQADVPCSVADYAQTIPLTLFIQFLFRPKIILQVLSAVIIAVCAMLHVL
jgi:hypothetical protein